MKMKAYKITVEKSISMSEQGTYYSLEPAESTRDIKVDCNPVDIELAHGAEVYDSELGDKRISCNEHQGLTLQEAIDAGIAHVV